MRCADRAARALQLEVRVDGPHVDRDEHARDAGQPDDHQERRVPAPAVRQVEADRDAHDLARGERGLHDAHHPPAQIQRKEIGDDREDDRADDAAEQAGHHARDQQEVVAGGDAAQERPEHESDVEEQQHALAIEAVGETGGQKTGGAGAEGIDRHHQPEGGRRDVQVAQQQGAQRRQDHEVEDDRELQEREDRDDPLLVRREERRGGCGGRCGGAWDRHGWCLAVGKTKSPPLRGREGEGQFDRLRCRALAGRRVGLDVGGGVGRGRRVDCIGRRR